MALIGGHYPGQQGHTTDHNLIDTALAAIGTPGAPGGLAKLDGAGDVNNAAGVKVRPPSDGTVPVSASNNPNFLGGLLSRAADTGGITVRTGTDPSAGNINWQHNSQGGYIIHLTQGSGMWSGAALIGLGGDVGGICLLVSNKATGRGIYVEQKNTITSATAYGFHGYQNSIAPMVLLEQIAANSAPLLKMVAQQSAAAPLVMTHQTGDTQTQSTIDTNGSLRRIYTTSGTAGLLFPTLELTYANNYQLSMGPPAAIGAEVVYPVVWAQNGKIGFLGSAPVGKAAAIPQPDVAPAAYSQTQQQQLVVAVNQLRGALVNLGLVTA